MKQVKTQLQQGFTLIELIIVIAIIAMISVIGVRNYGTLKEIQAKKANAANIKRIYNALAEYNEVRSGVTGRFSYFDSLIDMKAETVDRRTGGSRTGEELGVSQANAGLAGTYVWEEITNTQCIVYNGCWRMPGSRAYDSEEAKATREGSSANNGIPDNLANMVGIYYLTEDEAKLVREAGISYVLMHNNNSDATGTCLDQRGGGGPAFRPNMSAFAPAVVSNGTPVVVFRPDAASVHAGPTAVIGNLLYEDFGYALTNRYDLMQHCYNQWPVPDAFEKLLATTKLIAFGIGQGAECVVSKVGIGEAPVNPVYDRTYYRQYLAVFALKSTATGGQTGGSSAKCEFVGVVDCAGLTQNGANYAANWQSDGE